MTRHSAYCKRWSKPYLRYGNVHTPRQPHMDTGTRRQFRVSIWWKARVAGNGRGNPLVPHPRRLIA